MNHLRMANGLLSEPENTKAESVTPEGGMFVQALITNHALIAIAEQQQETLRKIGQIIEYGLPMDLPPETTNALNKIAEQLERMNNQELRTEKLDFHSITRKVDK